MFLRNDFRFLFVCLFFFFYRKNVIILTTDLTGAYDVDFRFLSRFYSTHPVDQVPSIYVDLQLPRFDAQKRVQPKLLLRVPVYAEDREGIGKVDRKQLVDESAVESHQLPFLYHFDITKHRYAPSKFRSTHCFT